MGVPKKITATEAARSFSAVVSRVRFQGDEFVVEKGGEPVCRISPVGTSEARSTVADLLRLLSDGPVVDEEFRKTIRTLGRGAGKLPKTPWG